VEEWMGGKKPKSLLEKREKPIDLSYLFTTKYKLPKKYLERKKYFY
jgi:hypothetical protein